MDNFTLTENNEIKGAVCPVCGSPVVVEFFQVDEVGDKAIYRYCCSAISSGDCVFSGGSDYSIRRVVESYRMRIARKLVEGKESPAKAGLFGTVTPRYRPGPKLSVAEDVEPEDAPGGDKPVPCPEMGLIMWEDGSATPGCIDPPYRRDRANRVFALMTAYVRSGCKLRTSTVNEFIELVDDAFFELRESAAGEEEGD